MRHPGSELADGGQPPGLEVHGLGLGQLQVGLTQLAVGLLELASLRLQRLLGVLAVKVGRDVERRRVGLVQPRPEVLQQPLLDPVRRRHHEGAARITLGLAGDLHRG